MSSQTIFFLVSFGGMQCLLLAAFFINKKTNRVGNMFLFFYLSVMALQILFKILNKVWLMENTGFFYSVAHYLPLLYGPMLLFFLSGRTGEIPTRKKVLLHLSPFLVTMTLIFIAEVVPSAYFFGWPFNPYLRLLLVGFSVTYYHIASLRMLQKKNNNIGPYNNGR